MDNSTFLHAIFLGIIEGLTEFIPVSSTGHLILLGELIGFEGPPGKVFEIVIQLGAIGAILWAYRKKLWRVVSTAPSDGQSRRFIYAICLAFLPAALLGAMFHSQIKAYLFSPLIVSVNLVIGGVIILLVERSNLTVRCTSIERMRLPTALGIGCAQAVAMMPGVSRSGATIIGALLMGVERKAATEFSFFLAIPTMIGATLFDLYANWGALNGPNFQIIAIGFICAFLSALIVVKAFVAFVSRHGFTVFAWYRIVIGSVMLALFL